mmetsp:Transcript_121504/g.350781  ORF Transcript_121504/g.350781 Transcript_121504/m.350781 type:complete len:216 (+) Transcript_121504:1190-1837(+)
MVMHQRMTFGAPESGFNPPFASSRTRCFGTNGGALKRINASRLEAFGSCDATSKASCVSLRSSSKRAASSGKDTSPAAAARSHSAASASTASLEAISSSLRYASCLSVAAWPKRRVSPRNATTDGRPWSRENAVASRVALYTSARQFPSARKTGMPSRRSRNRSNQPWPFKEMQMPLSEIANTTGHWKFRCCMYSARLMALRKCALLTEPSPTLT